MKIKKISKSSVKIFLTSLSLTAFFMLSLWGFIVAEKNSLKTGVREIKEPLSLYTSEKEIRLVVNDREVSLLLGPVIDALKSGGLGTLALVLLTL